MKKYILLFSYIACLWSLFCPDGQARFVTLMVTETNQTNQITIEDYETAKIVSFHDFSYNSCRYCEPLGILKDGTWLFADPDYIWSVWNSTLTPAYIPPSFGAMPFIITGPATISLNTVNYGSSPKIILTLEIVPEAYPPGRAITIAPGAGGAEITLETSTNLTYWTTATNGIYTNLTEAQFFRIKADRIR